MKQPLQTAGQLLRAAANQSDNLVGTQKPVPLNEPNDLVVAFRQFDWRNFGNALKARKSGHPASMTGIRKTKETLRFA
jgi:hypothetical protein